MITSVRQNPNPFNSSCVIAAPAGAEVLMDKSKVHRDEASVHADK